MKYRKKAVVVEAVQFTGEQPWPDKVYESYNGNPVIETRDGAYRLHKKDWIIEDAGFIEVVEPNIFKAEYERAEEMGSTPTSPTALESANGEANLKALLKQLGLPGVCPHCQEIGWTVFNKTGLGEFVGVTGVPHFTNCPDAARFKKEKESSRVEG
jgi:hypothetical protein